MSPATPLSEQCSTGIDGLDRILKGGLPRQRIYLIEGEPGTGKTTLGMQFLMEGVAEGERSLLVSLLQSKEELQHAAASHGWDLDGVEILELPGQTIEDSAADQTLFRRSDIELRDTSETILQAIEERQPQRLVFDSITELAVIVDEPFQLRRELLRLKDMLSGLSCTSLFCLTSGTVDALTVQMVAHGSICLQRTLPEYGQHHRYLEVHKMRSLDYASGRHDFRVATGGLIVYPRLLSWAARDRQERAERVYLASGNEQVDLMLGGGLESASSCLIAGSSGTGKSILASTYVEAAAKRGDKSVIFCFDERMETYLNRSEAVGLGIRELVEDGLVDLRQIDIGQISPGEFSSLCRQAVEEDGIKVLVVDSLSGYFNSMPHEHELMLHLHDLIAYLTDAGVLTLVVLTSHGIYGQNEVVVDASYLADAVILMRHFDAFGQLRRGMAVLKKRYGDHEKAIRELQISADGLTLGEPLTDFSGLFSNEPHYIGPREHLLDEQDQNGTISG